MSWQRPCGKRAPEDSPRTELMDETKEPRGRKPRGSNSNLSEQAWLNKIKRLAKKHGWSHVHLWTNIYSPAGFPDLLLAGPRGIMFAELKRQNGKLRSEQVAWIRRILAAGVHAFVWRPGDIAWVVRILEGTLEGQDGDGV